MRTIDVHEFLFSILHRCSTAGHYLVALSVADNCVLVGEALIWLDKHLDLRVTSQSNTMCRLTYFLRYGGRLWSALLATIITAERYLFIAHPLKSARFTTRFGARIMVFLVPVLSFGLTSYALYLLGVSPEKKQCEIIDDTYDKFIAWDLLISRLLCDVVTGCVVGVFTCMIIRALVIARRQRHRMLPDIVETCRQGVYDRELKLTLILVMIAISLLLLKLPYTVSWYVKHYMTRHQLSRHNVQMVENVVAVAYIFAVACYSTNLFLYSLGGSISRAKLKGHCRSITMTFRGRGHRWSTWSGDPQSSKITAV